jgi:hypothetical protein
MKAKLLLVMPTDKPRWVSLLIRALQHRFDVRALFVENNVKENGTEKTLADIISILSSENISRLLIFQEFFSIFHLGVIQLLRDHAVTGLIFFDDVHNHAINRINAHYADFVIVGPDAFEQVRFENYGIPSVRFCLENEASLPLSIDVQNALARPIDVFFAGYAHKPGRREYIDAVKKLRVRSFIHETEKDGSMPYSELYKVMLNSKVILNFSRTDNAGPAAYALGFRDPAVYQFKGRIIEAGLCGACCVSEYFPTISINSLIHCVPTFRSVSEMEDVLFSVLRSGSHIDLAATLRRTIENHFSVDQALDLITSRFLSPACLKDRRLEVCIDSQYVRNVVLRIQRFGYRASSIKDADMRFFATSIRGFGYANLSLKKSEDNYPFDI